jgi:CheY-like chemotaxis protein
MAEQTKKILIVDDDTFLLNMYSLKFSKNGYEVITSQNGADALKRLKEGLEPNVILLDVIMPGIDGIELLRQIRTENLGTKCHNCHAYQSKRYQ